MRVGSFGTEIVFEVSGKKVMTPHNVRREMSAAYEEHKVLGAKPRLEFLSPELNTCQLTVLLSRAHGVDPGRMMVRIEAAIAVGLVEKLILGGENYGRHVLIKASEEWTSSDGKGKPLSIRVTLDFKEYSA